MITIVYVASCYNLQLQKFLELVLSRNYGCSNNSQFRAHKKNIRGNVGHILAAWKRLNRGRSRRGDPKRQQCSSPLGGGLFFIFPRWLKIFFFPLSFCEIS